LATNIGEIPDELPLLLGEMLYQLRASLDACIYQGSINATGKEPSEKEATSLEFPITRNPKEWPKLKERRLSFLSISFQDALERIQPYNAESLPPEDRIKSVGRSLGILHDLDLALRMRIP